VKKTGWPTFTVTVGNTALVKEQVGRRLQFLLETRLSERSGWPTYTVTVEKTALVKELVGRRLLLLLETQP
jgi:peptide methionine sulfoxide reductase MsrB